jgi:Rieske Fe-S protein
MHRKQFLIGTAAGLAATVLAACSTYGKKPEQGSPPADDTVGATPGTGAPGPAPAAIAKTADVPVGSGIVVDEIVVTQPTDGEFKAFSSTCTHAGCTVKDVAGGTINCPCHGSKFNLDGTVANGPATRPLQSKDVTVQGDSIVLA